MELILNTEPLQAMHNSHLMVIKDNRLMEARFSLKLWEMRIFERMITMIDYGDREFRLCRLYIRDLLDFFTCTGHNNYELIREAANSLADKKIHVRYEDEDRHHRWAKLSIFPTVTMPDEATRQGEPAYIELAFHQDLKPYLIDLKARFKAYQIGNIRALQSIYSIRLFILLKQYEGAKEHTFDMPFLRNLLGIEQDEYTNFSDFKRRVLVRPQKDLLKYCDICFEFTELTEGKRVIAISFVVRKNKNVTHAAPTNRISPKQELSFILSQNQVLLSPVWSLAQQWGISEKVFLQVIHSTPFPKVQLCVDFIYYLLHHANVEIKNVPAYFYALIKLANVDAEALKSKTASKIPRIEKINQKAKPVAPKSKTAIEKELIVLKRELFAREDQIMNEFVQTMDDDARQQFLHQIQLSPLARYDQNLSLDDNFRYNRVFRFATKANIIHNQPQIFSKHNNLLRQEIQRLQKTYNAQ